MLGKKDHRRKMRVCWNRIWNVDIWKALRSCKYWGKDEKEKYKMIWAYVERRSISEPIKKNKKFEFRDLKRCRVRQKIFGDKNRLWYKWSRLTNKDCWKLEWRGGIFVDESELIYWVF